MADKARVAIATMGRITNEREGYLVWSTMKNLAALGIPVCVAWGGTEEEAERIRDLSPYMKVEVVKGGLAAQLAWTLGSAADVAENVMYLEGDKAGFSNDLSSNLSIALTELAAMSSSCPGLIVFERYAAAFLTFPDFQQATEGAMNTFIERMTGKAKRDHIYGPKLMNRAIALYSAAVTTSERLTGWQPLLAAVGYAYAYGAVLGIEGQWECPVEQRSEVDRAAWDHRLGQLTDNVAGFMIGYGSKKY